MVRSYKLPVLIVMEAEGPVSDPGLLLQALERAVQVVKIEKRPFLLDVVTIGK